MFAANSELDVRPRPAAARGGDFDEFAHALLVEGGERAGRENSLGRIVAKKRSGIVARKSEAGLGQVIGAKRKELGGLGEVAGAQARAGGLDHRANQIGHNLAGLGGVGLRDGIDPRLDKIEFGLGDDERYHDLRPRHRAGLAFGRDRAFENGAGLHFRDFGKGDREPTAAKTQHRVRFL